MTNFILLYQCHFQAIYNMVGDTLEEKQNGLFSANVTRKVINDEMVMVSNLLFSFTI